MRILNLAILAVVLGQVACVRHADPLQEALASGRWNSVLQRTGAAPVSGFLRAQTLLAGNRNNEAVCEILQEDTAALAEYQSVTRKLAARYPHSAVAQYLLGDSLARSSRWTEAIASFDRALAVNRTFALALMARGVARVSSGKLKQGKDDLYLASTIDSKLAETQAAIGWTLLKEGQPAASARKYFEEAMKLSPGYSLAEFGKGLAEIASGNPEAGEGEVAGPLRPGNCAAGLLVSDALVAVASGGVRGTGERDELPGTQINTTIKYVQSVFSRVEQGDSQALNEANRFIGIDQRYEPMMAKALKAVEQNHPDIYAKWQQDVHSHLNFVQPGDWAQTILHAAQTAQSAAVWALGQSKSPVLKYGGQALGGMLSYSIQHQIENTKLDYAGWSTTNRLLNPQGLAHTTVQPAGATTNLDGARLDSGHWPFEPVFGLLYPKS